MARCLVGIAGSRVKGRDPKSGELEGCHCPENEERVVRHARRKRTSTSIEKYGCNNVAIRVLNWVAG